MEVALDYLAYNSAIYEEDYPYISGNPPYNNMTMPCLADQTNAPGIYVDLDI